MHAKTALYLFLIMCCSLVTTSQANADEPANEPEPQAEVVYGDDPFAEDPFEDDIDDAIDTQQYPDPIQGYNRFMFAVNDKIYTYGLTPTAKGLAFVLPEQSRVCVKNFFYNLSMPIRTINCLLQGRGPDVGVELWRFIINSTAGIGGLFDPASSIFYLPTYEEDTGLTFGTYGAGPGFYFVLPLVGPSSGRDSVGLLCDILMDPLTYVFVPAVRTVEEVNNTSLNPDEYSELKAASLDPYTAFRNGFLQNREAAIAK
jgi:phospholipid-binding lipoprotein MlaA